MSSDRQEQHRSRLHIIWRWIATAQLMLVAALPSEGLNSIDTSTARQTNPGASNYAALSREISNLLSSPLLRTTRLGLMVWSLDRDTMVFARGSDEKLTPASLTKLYYTAAAFATMGPEYSIQTVVATNGTITNGTVEGDLYVIGHGDCLLTLSELEALADKLRTLGIRRIRGSIIADATYFDPIVDRQQYSGDDERMENLPPISALGIEGNRLTVVVTRGRGTSVRVRSLPSSDAIATTWTSLPVRTAPSEPRRRTRQLHRRQRYGGRLVIRHRTRRRTVGVSLQPVKISSSLRSDGVQEIRVFGMPRPNSSVSFTVTMLDPPLVVAGAFKQSLSATGIAVEGGIGKGAAPSTVRRLTSWERPLHDLVMLCNKNSDNFIAEHVMKILGAYCSGNSQCNVNAYRSVVALLDSVGLDGHGGGVLLYDGSGLSRRNRATASSLVGLLRYCAQQPWSESFFGTLAVAGEDGTLTRRMRRTPAEGNLRAKTGTHRNVSGLAGIVRALNGERFVFAVIWNGNNVGLYKQLENQLGEILASFGSKDTPSTEESSR